jgi:polar amino acid transport system substrate-binding protein
MRHILALLMLVGMKAAAIGAGSRDPGSSRDFQSPSMLIGSIGYAEWVVIMPSDEPANGYPWRSPVFRRGFVTRVSSHGARHNRWRVIMRLRPVRAAAVLAAVALLAVIGVAACAKKGSAETTAGGVKLVKKGALVTCTHLPYPPFQSKDQSGKVVGFDVDIVDLAAKKLGVTQEIVDTPFEGIKSGQDLNTGKCDVAAAGMTITDARKQVLDFSDPYFDATQALAVPAGKPYRALADLTGKRLGVQGDTTGEDYTKAQIKDKSLNIELVSYKDLGSEQQALATGQIEAAVGDLPVWNEYVKNNPGKVVVAAGFDTGERYGLAVKKGGNPKLLQTINDAITEAKSNGTYDRIYQKWIGANPTS